MSLAMLLVSIFGPSFVREVYDYLGSGFLITFFYKL